MKYTRTYPRRRRAATQIKREPLWKKVAGMKTAGKRKIKRLPKGCRNRLIARHTIWPKCPKNTQKGRISVLLRDPAATYVSKTPRQRPRCVAAGAASFRSLALRSSGSLHPPQAALTSAVLQAQQRFAPTVARDLETQINILPNRKDTLWGVFSIGIRQLPMFPSRCQLSIFGV